jgi:hypothetical protein
MFCLSPFKTLISFWWPIETNIIEHLKFEDTKGITKNGKLVKGRQYNGLKKKDKQ